VDPEGLCLTTVDCTCMRQPATCATAGITAAGGVQQAAQNAAPVANALVCRGGDFAGLMNEVNPFADTLVNAVPGAVRLAQTLPTLTPAVTRVVQQAPDWLLKMGPTIERTGWYVRTLNEYRSYWTNLSPEESKKFLDYMDWLLKNL
jgi:hypothetical protein